MHHKYCLTTSGFLDKICAGSGSCLVPSFSNFPRLLINPLLSNGLDRMDTGRKAHTFSPGESCSRFLASSTMWARNLSKYQLGGVIFGCTSSTMRQCLANQLFGLPAQHFSYVKNIKEGLPLFLFNYTERKLYGIYEAACSGQMNIDLYAWTEDGSERTKYPAQVQVRVRLQTQGLSEVEFKPIIIDNYYSRAHFWFELDHAQASKLISKLSSLAIAPGPVIQHKALKLANAAQKAVIKKLETNGALKLQLSAEDSSNSRGYIGTSDHSLGFDGNNHLKNSSLGEEVLDFDEKYIIYMKLKELAESVKFPQANRTKHAMGAASISDVDLEYEAYDDNMLASDKSAASSFVSLDYPSIVEQLRQEIEELKAFNHEHTRKTEILEKKLADTEKEIHRLESRGMMLESVSDTWVILPGEEMLVESLPGEFPLNHEESILLVGGYDGGSWSSALHSFSPSHDVLRSLKSMTTVRSYTSVARFNGELYVLGGGDGSMWYDTVESYNAAKDEWALCPSLNKAKGNLGAAALTGKIFAIGGGNGVECFSDVEMFDPYLGRWIYARSMLQKRFAVATAELNGALYAAGGYDGDSYLRSAERFDPREHSWTRIGSMHAKRSCLSLIAMNEKLYSIGGYDGANMVGSVEIYDPRLDTWMTGEVMNHARGYLSAAVLKDSIYAIGGVERNHSIVDKIECFKEGGRWEETQLSAVGKRCFASAIVLEGD